MSQNHVILLLGTNLGDKEKNLKTAKTHIISEIGEIFDESEILTTEAEGYVSNHLFLNQTVKLRTEFSPIGVLIRAKNIEKMMGRIYSETNQKFQDRLIDIDLLKFNRIKYESQSLIIPHPQIYTRNFIKKIADCHLET